jgi:D-alanyl-lipoteichoic acid acyltransferase DltB (MBOAT superfamily)
MVFENPNEWQGIPIILAIIFFSIQIYCDFSGYSDIAIGTAKTMGFDLMLNFNRPYLSKSLGEFWSKWHVSLSTWFRDYVYISLGGNRISRQRTYFNLLFIFILSGLWHGSNWTFIIWGIFHGCFLIIERIFSIEKYTNKTLPIFWFIYTFIIVSVGWVFFRAETISDALIIFKNAAILSKDQIGWYMFGNYKYELIVGLCAIIVLVFLEVKKTNNGIDVFKNLPKFIRIFVYILFLVLFLLFGAFHNSTEFIYFQF